MRLQGVFNMNYLQMKKRALLNNISQSSGRLPREYQEVEWVGSDGYSWIISRYSENSRDKIYIKVSLDSGSTTSEQGFFGVNARAELLFSDMKFNTWRYIDSPQEKMPIEYDTPYEIQAYYEISLGGTELLFRYRTDAYPFWGKIYYCRITDVNDNPIRDFVPCYRKSDGEIGMYDLVTNTFFTNQGTGNFTKGNNVYT